VLAALTRRREDIRGFVDRADQVAQEVASHSGDLGTAVDRLPPVLARLEPAAKELDGLVREGRPLVSSLGPAAKPLYELLGDFKPLSDAAAPVVSGLKELTKPGRHAAAVLRPTTRILKPITTQLVPIGDMAADLNDSLRDRGVVENILAYVYRGAGALARFDRFSHMLPSYQLARPTCQDYATTPTDGCDAHYAGGKAAAKPAAKDGATNQALDYLLGK
jgi:ABC-type transporter Mla subunit MlaD